MNEPQLSAEGKLNILELVDPKVPYSHFVRVLEKYTQEVIATALEEQATRHAMLMAGLEAQIEQKAVIRASELVDKARATEREKVLSEVNEAVTQRVLPAPLLGHYTEDRLHQRWQVELNQLKGGE